MSNRFEIEKSTFLDEYWSLLTAIFILICSHREGETHSGNTLIHYENRKSSL